MLKANLSDGTTREYDLSDRTATASWESDANSGQIRAISILHEKTLHTLPLPKGFQQVRLFADLLTSNDNGQIVGERVACEVSDIRVSLTVYHGHTPRMTRLDVRRLGQRRFDPNAVSRGGSDE